MKITKFREVLTGEQIEQHQEVVKQINDANSRITSAVEDANSSITTAVENVESGVQTVSSEVKNVSSNIQDTNQKLDKLTEDVIETIKGSEARSDKTKIYNQKVEEDIIILESPDEDFSIPDDTCDDIFIPTLKTPESKQFFVLTEDTPETRCYQRKLNFDTDQPYAIRMDQYSGDALGYFHAYGHSKNNSSDISIINDTYFKIKIRTSEKEDFLTVDDGFTATIDDVEKEDLVTIKRDHTISGYTLTYSVEGKMNA
jgi:uncharacterized protein YukE